MKWNFGWLNIHSYTSLLLIFRKPSIQLGTQLCWRNAWTCPLRMLCTTGSWVFLTIEPIVPNLLAAYLASIVQGSGIGPVTYVICASDLFPLHKSNSFDKYADNSYLIVPSVNSSTIAEELEHIAKWAHDNNLKLNRSKTKEIGVHRPRAKNWLFPPAVDGVERLDVINVLGVLVDSTLSFHAQVDRLVGQSAQTLYALRILKRHGLCGSPLWNVATATLLSRLLYASPVWWGMVSGVFRISKRGPNFRWPLVLTQRGGPNQVFQFFSLSTKIFFGQGGPWHNGLPPKYASGYGGRWWKA